VFFGLERLGGVVGVLVKGMQRREGRFPQREREERIVFFIELRCCFSAVVDQEEKKLFFR